MKWVSSTIFFSFKCPVVSASFIEKLILYSLICTNKCSYCNWVYFGVFYSILMFCLPLCIDIYSWYLLELVLLYCFYSRRILDLFVNVHRITIHYYDWDHINTTHDYGGNYVILPVLNMAYLFICSSLIPYLSMIT